MLRGHSRRSFPLPAASPHSLQPLHILSVASASREKTARGFGRTERRTPKTKRRFQVRGFSWAKQLTAVAAAPSAGPEEDCDVFVSVSVSVCLCVVLWVFFSFSHLVTDGASGSAGECLGLIWSSLTSDSF